MMNDSPRIVSLLPGLTDTVLALGLGRCLVGISHECDLPDGWEEIPRLTRCRFDASADSEAIDWSVRNSSTDSLYELDSEQLQKLCPDVVLTQAQCDVCAVSEATLEAALAKLAIRPKVLSVDPQTLGDVFTMVREVGQTLNKRHEAEAIVRAFESAESALISQIGTQPAVNVIHLEWLSPPMSSGHWIPELIRMAGGNELTARPGQPSRVISDRMLREVFTEKKVKRVILGVCGFTVERTIAELNELPEDHILAELLSESGCRVFAVDGHRHFVRPGPLLLGGLGVVCDLLGKVCEGVVPSALGELDLTIRMEDRMELVKESAKWKPRNS